jgi:hypothetical protein
VSFLWGRTQVKLLHGKFFGPLIIPQHIFAKDTFLTIQGQSSTVGDIRMPPSPAPRVPNSNIPVVHAGGNFDFSGIGSSFRILIQSAIDPLSPILCSFGCLLSQVLAFCISSGLVFSSPVTSSSAFIVSLAGATICCISDNVMSVRESLRRPHSNHKLTAWDYFSLIVSVSSLVIAWGVTCALSILADDENVSYSKLLTQLLMSVTLFQACAMVIVLIKKCGESVAINLSLGYVVSDFTVPTSLYICSALSIIFAALIVRAAMSHVSSEVLRAYSAAQMIFWVFFTIIDILFRRVPWCNFVKFFVGSRRDLRSEISLLFAMRTIIPVSWIWAFCGSFVFEKLLMNESLANSHTHRFGIPCVTLEAIALLVSMVFVATFLRIRWKRRDPSQLDSVEIMLHADESRRSSSAGFKVGESRNHSVSYGAVEVF